MTDTALSPEAQQILDSGDVYTRSQEFLNGMAERDSARDSHYTTFEQFYSGENHRTRLNDRTKLFLQRSGFFFCENFCEVVVDVLAERMQIEVFDSENEELRTWLEGNWRFNRMDEMQGIVHTNTLMKGDGYVIVDLDTRLNKPKIHWNRPEIIKPVYDTEHPDLIICAAKRWVAQTETPTNPNARKITRMNIYLPDRIEKWFCEGKDATGDWVKHLDPSDTEWPIKWIDSNGEPLGVPVFHFRNKAKGKTWGVSEIRNTIPQQEFLNKQIIDLSMILDQQGWPQRWGVGIRNEERGKFTGNVGTVWLAGATEARFGQFDSADPAGTLRSIEASLQRVAGRSRTPLFLLILAGDAPSGESLKTAEAGLIAKAKDRHTSTGNTWSEVMLMGARLAQTQGELAGIDLTPDLISVIWKDPESRNELEQRQSLEIDVDKLGVSKRTAQISLGYDPDEESSQKKDEQNEAVTQFNRGPSLIPLPAGSNGGQD